LKLDGRSHRPDLDPVVLSIEAKLRRTGKGKRLLIENGSKAEFNADLATMITEAFAIRNQLLSGSDTSSHQVTRARCQERDRTIERAKRGDP
jgi:site-specific DNA recombinase